MGQKTKEKKGKKLEEKSETDKVDKCSEYIQIDTNNDIQENQQEYIQQKENKEIEKEKEIESNTKEQLYKKYNKEINEIINYLNKQTNKKFTTDSVFVKNLIVDRLEEEHTIDEFKSIIDYKIKEWINNKNYNKNLRPGTLFSENNFVRYLNESVDIVVPPSSLLNSVLVEIADD